MELSLSESQGEASSGEDSQGLPRSHPDPRSAQVDPTIKWCRMATTDTIFTFSPQLVAALAQLSQSRNQISTRFQAPFAYSTDFLGDIHSPNKRITLPRLQRFFFSCNFMLTLMWPQIYLLTGSEIHPIMGETSFTNSGRKIDGPGRPGKL